MAATSDILKLDDQFHIYEVVSERKAPHTIEIVESDPTWPKTFDSFKSHLITALGSRAARIEHVGSTSVPGLPAKPVIDIDLIVDDIHDEASYVPALEAAGFQFLIRWKEHCMFSYDEPQVNLHVYGPEWPEPKRHRLFRDWLKKNSEDRELYANVKREASQAASAAGEDVNQYNDRKQAVLLEILNRAFRDAGYLQE